MVRLLCSDACNVPAVYKAAVGSQSSCMVCGTGFRFLCYVAAASCSGEGLIHSERAAQVKRQGEWAGSTWDQVLESKFFALDFSPVDAPPCPAGKSRGQLRGQQDQTGGAVGNSSLAAQLTACAISSGEIASLAPCDSRTAYKSWRM